MTDLSNQGPIMASSTLDLTGPGGQPLTVPGVATFPIPDSATAANDAAKTEALTRQAVAGERLATAAEIEARALAAQAGTLNEPYPDHEVWMRAVVSYKPSAFAEANPTLALAYGDAVLAGYKQRFAGPTP